MTNEQMTWTILGYITGLIIAQSGLLLTIMFKINNDSKDSINKRIDDLRDSLKDLFKSEIKRLEDKIEPKIKVN